MVKYLYLVCFLFSNKPLLAKGLDAIADSAPDPVAQKKVEPVDSGESGKGYPKDTKSADVKTKDDAGSDEETAVPVKKAEVVSEFVKNYENKIFLGTGLFVNNLKTQDGDVKSDGSGDAYLVVDVQKNEKTSLRIGFHYAPIAARLIADNKSYKGSVERFGIPFYMLSKKQIFNFGGFIEPSFDRVSWFNDDGLDKDSSQIKYQMGISIGGAVEFKLSDRVYVGPKFSKSFGYVDNFQFGISSVFVL